MIEYLKIHNTKEGTSSIKIRSNLTNLKNGKYLQCESIFGSLYVTKVGRSTDFIKAINEGRDRQYAKKMYHRNGIIYDYETRNIIGIVGLMIDEHNEGDLVYILEPEYYSGTLLKKFLEYGSIMYCKNIEEKYFKKVQYIEPEFSNLEDKLEFENELTELLKYKYE